MINHKVDRVKERRRMQDELRKQELAKLEETGVTREEPKLRKPGEDYRDELKKLNEGRELKNDPMFVPPEDLDAREKRKRRERRKRR